MAREEGSREIVEEGGRSGGRCMMGGGGYMKLGEVEEVDDGEESGKRWSKWKEMKGSQGNGERWGR